MLRIITIDGLSSEFGIIACGGLSGSWVVCLVFSVRIRIDRIGVPKQVT